MTKKSLKKFGVGDSTFLGLKKKFGLNKNLTITKTMKEHQHQVLTAIERPIFGYKLKIKIKSRLSFLMDQVRNFRGIRHKYTYPVRGQRTKTNAKTKRKFKFRF
jgi:small subunit ribosomal protein S13